MKIKKKASAGMAAILAAVIFLCAGCGMEEAATVENHEKSLALLISQEDEFLLDLKENIQAEAAAQGYRVQYYTAEGDSTTQLLQVHEALASGVETLIVNLTNDENSEEIANIVGDAKVVLVNRAPINRAILNEKMVFVGMDETQCGILQGEALADYFWENAQGTEIRYLLFQGVPGLENTNERSNGAIQGLMDVSFAPVAAAAFQVCDFYRDEARDAMQELLKQEVAFDCVICNNDAMALGVIEAMESAGMSPEDVPIVGIDYTADGAAALQAGKLYMTVDQNARMQAETAVAVAMNLDQGRAFDSGLGQIPDLDYAAQTQPYMVRIPVEAVVAE